MAKISPVSIKYLIHASFVCEGALEKPDVIGAIFGQTEGLLGAELEMRELQKEGKIGRIEVDIERKGKQTHGVIHIPTALDQSETTLIAAAIETIERIGPCDSQIEVDRIEDVRGSKRDYIIERAKKLMQGIEGSTDSRVISTQIKDSARIAEVKEYGKSRLPCGDLSGKEIIVVEGRADVLNLLRAGVNNVIAMNGTKLPDEIKELGKEKEITLYLDGDRGGKLIAQNVVDNAEIKYVVVAPDGKEVEELTGKEILMDLRKRVLLQEFLSRNRMTQRKRVSGSEEVKEVEQSFEFDDEKKEELKNLGKKIDGSGKAVLFDSDLKEIKSVSAKMVSGALKRTDKQTSVVILDGTVTSTVIRSAEDANVSVIVAKNFAANSDKIKMLSL